MTTPPTYLFLENVKNFETSRSRERLVILLHKMGYVFRECLLAPHNFGVPNDRLRYFLMARLRSTFDQTALSSKSTSTTTKKMFDPETEIIYTAWPFPAFVESPEISVPQHPFKIPELRYFLDQDENSAKDYLLSRQLILERPNFRFAYGSHHVASGGGLLQTLKMDRQEYDFGNSESIADLGLRFFTPTEVARLHVFPLKGEQGTETPFIEQGEDQQESEQNEKTTAVTTVTAIRPFNPRLAQKTPEGPFLQFPDKLKALQRYKLLGNSLNVWVVAELLRGILFADHPGSPRPTYYTSDNDQEISATKVPISNKHTIEQDLKASVNGTVEGTNSVDETARDTKRSKVE
ncbi:tRNA (cytosine-5-)-methyltransferase [Mortierella sp. GBA30]|nr:tRNA (cytosine-5-)-methyltransferase [Mortierella sp. GBA30]